MAELIEMPLTGRLRFWVDPVNHVLDRGFRSPMGKGKFWGEKGVPL